MLSILQQFSKEKNIYIIRHAESVCNRDGVIAGRIETPLTETGRGQAQKTGLWCKSKEIQHILHSPLSRAEETAKIIQKELPKNHIIEAVDDLIEISAGIFEKLHRDELHQRYKDIFPLFLQKSWEAVEEAEKISDLVPRALRVWEKVAQILSMKDLSSILIVSHGGFIQWLLKTSYGVEGSHLKSWAPIVKVSNCGIYHLKIKPAVTAEKKIIGAYAIWEEINRVVY